MPAVITIGALMGACLAFVLFSRLFYHRSAIATLVEWYLFLTEKHYKPTELLSALQERREHGEDPYILPKSVRGRGFFHEYRYEDMQVFHTRYGEKSKKAVIYLHGGAYYRKPRGFHIRFAERMSRRTGLPFILPIYQKAPLHTCRDAYQLLPRFYLEQCKQYDTLILMGDSSGGGLALGLAQYLSDKGIRPPSALILMSPWVDVALKNPDIPRYEAKDPIVFLDNVTLLGRAWADDLPPSDPRVSPLHGSLCGLCHIHLFCGKREVLYPDCCLLHEKLRDCDTPVRFYRGEGMNHVYPIFPIPEAKKAQKAICRIIEES